MTCPRCSASLSNKKYEGIAIDLCGQCGGAWLDAGELIPIVSTVEEKFSTETIRKALCSAGAGVSDPEVHSTEKCPKCAALMLPQNYNYSSGIIIDVCPKGHGLWFDRSELEQVQIHIEHWEKKKADEGAKWAEKVKMARQEGEHSLEKNRKKIAEVTSGPTQKLLMRVVTRLKKLT